MKARRETDEIINPASVTGAKPIFSDNLPPTTPNTRKVASNGMITNSVRDGEKPSTTSSRRTRRVRVEPNPNA